MIDVEDAISPEELDRAFEVGAALVEEELAAGTQLLVLGDLGIGNTTPAATLTGLRVESVLLTVVAGLEMLSIGFLGHLLPIEGRRKAFVLAFAALVLGGFAWILAVAEGLMARAGGGAAAGAGGALATAAPAAARRRRVSP